ncbi:MAG TPA: MEDS domain-containing protein [Azospirillaceae bacterium]|nr:MEDS domain-containing protein [Azospirillaceae bacterium]
MNGHTNSGVDAVGPLAWGSHFCQFYKHTHDLSEMLVPFFKAGLEAREKCLWITSEPLPADQAEAALKTAVPDLDRRKAEGQIEIIDHHEWYLRRGTLSADQILRGWLDQEEEALAAGYRGLRLTGNTFWLEPHHWRAFQEYESAVTGGFQSRRIVALCTYCLDRCDAMGVLDVVRAHQFTVARRYGDWEIVESASLRTAKEELHRVNRQLEERVRERTNHLARALADKDVLIREIHHRVRNNLQVVLSLLGTKQRQLHHEDARNAFQETINRVHSIALVHDALHKNAAAAVDVPTYLGELCGHLERAHGAHGSRGRVSLKVEAAPLRLELDVAVSLGLIVNEVVWNAYQHAFPDHRDGRITVDLTTATDEVELSVRDNGIGFSDEAMVASRGAGLQIVARLAAGMDGRLEIGPDLRRGTLIRLRFSPQPVASLCP